MHSFVKHGHIYHLKSMSYLICFGGNVNCLEMTWDYITSATYEIENIYCHDVK